MRAKSLLPIILLMFVLLSARGIAQTPGINDLIAKIQSYNRAVPTEKLFLQLDKPYYSTDDTIWFKAYLMNQSLNYSPLSTQLYVELLNDSAAVIKRYILPMDLGLTWGNIPLDATYVHEGTYTIRAYTNWMRNFGDDYYFKRSFYVNNKGENSWLVNVKSHVDTVAGIPNAKIALNFKMVDNKPFGLRDLQLTLYNGKKVLTHAKAQTDENGAFNFNYNLPVNSALKNFSVLAQDKIDPNKKVLIPVRINRPQDVDVQFMPEGGALVEGLPSHIGFKVVGEDGKGIDVDGTVTDNNGNTMAEIKTTHNGMGTFDLSPQPATVYTAKVNLPGGGTKSVQLPVVLKTGSILKVKNILGRDTMTVSVLNTAEKDTLARYYLLGISRGVVCYGAVLRFQNNFVITHVPKSLFPTGLAHFILLNANQQPVNERITFINHNDGLNIQIKTPSAKYNSRDSIPVQISVKDADGKPVVASLSMAVTDDGQVKPDAITADNIAAHMLLSADLKGYIEDPSFYFSNNQQAWPALDALMLTQGWVGYDLRKIDKLPKFDYQAEKEFAVNGVVTNILNRPIEKAGVLLLSKGTPEFIKDTITDQQGRFLFKNFPPITKSTFIISARNSKGKVINGGISVDEKNQSSVTGGSTFSLIPWYIDTDTAVQNYVNMNKRYHDILDREILSTGGKLLRAVNIKETSIIKGSQNLNGPDGSDQVIGEDVLVDAGKATLLDVIESKVKGFHTGFYKDSTNKMVLEYLIKDKRVHFVFDGIDLDRFYQPFGGIPNEHNEYQKQYLDYIAAADVLGIEVIYTRNGLYNQHNIDNVNDLLATTATGPIGTDIAYL